MAVRSVLAHVPGLNDFTVTAASVEAQTSFDGNPRGPRNHDLLLTGSATVGGVVVSVEAKAGEPYAETLGNYLASATTHEGSGKEARLRGLVDALAPHLSLDDPMVRGLRWQLFTGLAGAVAAATDSQATHAVFLIHELVTDRNTAGRRAVNDEDLKAFGVLVFERDLPAGDASWCVGPLAIRGSDRLDPSVKLYLGKAVTDLRPRRFDAA